MVLGVVEVEYNDWLPNNTQGETSRKPVLDIPVRIVHPHDACAGLCMEQIKMTNRDVQSTKGTAVCVLVSLTSSIKARVRLHTLNNI
jgi:hypothetical protein